MAGPPTVILHWLPLGAGGTVVRLSGRLWEVMAAHRDRRRPAPLFHSALELDGPAGAAWAGRFRVFRYELRCWGQGRIPDLEFETGDPVILSDDPAVASHIVDLTSQVPMLVWGRDELRMGEMWNSNSVIAWLLAGAGLELDGVAPPDGGIAPGWQPGIEAVRLAPPRGIS